MRAIPSVERVKDEELRRILSAIKEALEGLAGMRGSINDRALIVSDLTNLGIIRVHGTKLLYNPNPAETPSFYQPANSTELTVVSGSFDAVNPSTGVTNTFTVTNGKITAIA